MIPDNEAAREAARMAVATNAPAARTPAARTPAMSPDDIHDRFAYHPPQSEERKNAHADVRDICERVAIKLAKIVPAGREMSLAINKLEEVMFWANAALARAEDPDAGKAKVVTARQKGQRAYQAYADATGGKTFDGRDMPDWSGLGDKIQAAWIAAATTEENE